MKANFTALARRIGRELFPPHVDILTSFDDPFVREDTADVVEIRAVDNSGDEPVFGVVAIPGQHLRSPNLARVVLHEMSALAEKMGFADKETRHG